MKYLRLLLSAMSVTAAILWSQLILPWRNEPMPFSGWGDGAAGSATTLEGPIFCLWFITMFAFGFISIKPHVRSESGFIRAGRWLTNALLFIIALVLVIYARNGPATRFFALYGLVALASMWVYVDINRSKVQL